MLIVCFVLIIVWVWRRVHPETSTLNARIQVQLRLASVIFHLLKLGADTTCINVTQHFLTQDT